MRWLLTLVLLIGPAFSAAAQDDKDRITQYLETALSELGREVRIEGFQGALSSRATMKTLTIADDDGVWLTMTDAVLDWNPTAILGGRVEINELSASSIDLPRMPSSEQTVSPEAGTFSLPELPVSFAVNTISVDRVVLGQPVVGVPVTISVKGSVSLADGQGVTELEIARLDGPTGEFNLDAEYSNLTRVLAVDLSLVEAENGIAANLLNLPGQPDLELSVSGNAVIDEFAADIVLKSDGQQRLTGRIETSAPPEPDAGSTESDALPRVIQADIAGDLTQLFAPQYQAFFGPDVSLKSRVSLFADGRTSLDTLTITAAALRLSGALELSSDQLPEKFNLDVVLQDGAGNPVLLPTSGSETLLKGATLNASFDSSLGDAWTLTGDLRGLQRADMTLNAVQLAANGVIQRGQTRYVTARIDSTATGVQFTDPALAQALGTNLTLGGDFEWRDGQPLDVTNLEIGAQGLEFSGAGSVDGLESAVSITGVAQAQVSDLKRFSDMLGQPVSGAMKADLSGTIALLTGETDFVLEATATDLGIGIPDIDAALAGESQLNVAAARTIDGLTLRGASITTNSGDAEVSGLVSTGSSDLQFQAALENVGQFIDVASGPARLTGHATEDASGWTLAFDTVGPNTITARADVAVPSNGPISARIDANIGSVTWIVPDLAGSATVGATITQTDNDWAVTAGIDGPGGSNLNVVGQVGQDAKTAALDLDGSLPLALLNRQMTPNSAQGLAQFDLRLDGPLAVSSLSGQATTSGARLSFPALRNALTDIDATMTVAGGGAEIRANSKVATGGRLSAQGRVGLQASQSTDVAVKLSNVTVTDPELYETKVNGDLTLGGAIPNNLSLSGRLVLDQTEIIVPSTGIGAFGDIPEITHLNEPVNVRRTRLYSGLLADDKSVETSSGGGIGLNIQIIAENRIFVRGRGLDAELGGQLQLTGTTSDIIPQGGFELIRGRLDILGKRLDLQEGTARLRGGLIPDLRLVAQTTSDDTVIFVIIEGPADAPEISFTSTPELPSDEVLARLLFGRGVTTISALQAVQLASAVATLAGRGGGGIIEKLRQNTGFDDLDLSTSADGNTSLRIGKYISEKVYTDVEIDSDGKSQINLNLELSNSTKLRGQVGTDGSSGIGVFFERDY